MERVKINNLRINKGIGFGSYSDIFRVEYNNKEYAFKKFLDKNIVRNQEFLEKIDILSNIPLEKSILPKFIVEEKEEIGYLTELEDYKDLGFLYSLSMEEKINKLRLVKSSLLEIHKEGIIHSDIHTGNFLLRSSKLIDFDNSTYKKFLTDFDKCSREAKKFIKNKGISKDLDIYLFNLMTFRILNNITSEYDMSLYLKRYGVFTSNESIKICDSLLLEDKTFNTDYLIDTVECNKLLKSKF